METQKTSSAGGIILNKKSWILLTNQRGTTWSFPKGHIEANETELEAAIREIEEETGITRLTLIKKLGSYSRYKIGLNGKDDLRELKTLHFFLFRTDEQNIKSNDPNHPHGQWVHQDDVEFMLTHPKDKAFFKSVRGQLK